MHFAEAESVTQTVGCLRQLCEFFSPFFFKQIELRIAVREVAQAYPKQADFPFHVPILAKQLLKHGINIGVELRGLCQRLRACVRFKSGVANRQRERPRRQSRFAQPLARFLRKVAENRGHLVHFVRVFSKREIVRNGFRLRVNHELVGITPARFAIKRFAPLAKNLFQLFLWKCRELLYGIDAQRPQRALCYFANTGNLANRQRREKT